MKALINKIIPFSSVDGPGNRTAVFLQGCNINCLYCHNPETINICNDCGACVSRCPVSALEIKENKVLWKNEKCLNCDKCIEICPNDATPRVKEYEVNELLDEILKCKHFITGITFSGGECTLQSEFIIETAKKLKKHGLTTFVDTNGLLDFTLYADLIEAIDMFMLDIKAWNKVEHVKLTSEENETIIKNLKFLIREKKLFEVRTVVVPNLLSNEKTVAEVSKLIADLDIRYKLIKYRSKGARKELITEESPDDKYMQKLKELAKSNGVKNIVII